MNTECDLVNRDPNSINEHLKVSFEDILAEPEGARSFDCVWKASFFCFTFWQNLCYRIGTTLFGICIAAEWGCEFAYISFWHVWYITPMLKVLEINCAVLQKIYGLCIHCCLDPFCEAIGLVFTSFKR